MSPSLRVAAAALDPRRREVEHNLAAAAGAVERAYAAGARLIALPEMWPTSFTAGCDEGLVRAGEEAVAELARVAPPDAVLVGSAYGGGATDLPTNRAHVLSGGEVVASYDKVHLFSPTAENLAFRAGDDAPPAVGTEAGVVAPVVCYDLRFAELVRAPVRQGAEVLVVVAQWPASRATHWRALVQGRAAEGQCFVVAANRSGVDEIGRRRLPLEFAGNGLVAGPDGRLVAEAPRDAENGLLFADIELEEARELRRLVPVIEDERRELYGRW